MKVKKTSGFTLIELLVVISIISMLSSVLLVSLQGARDKGRVGAGVQFSAHNYQGFGDKVLLNWNFNSDSTGGGTVTDMSGNGVTGTPFGNPTFDTSSTPTGSGKALLIANSGQYATANFPSPPAYTDHTVSIWVKPTGSLSDPNGFGVAALTGYRDANGFGPKNVAINITPTGIIFGWSGCYNSSTPYTFQLGKWQQVTYTYSGSVPQTLTLYVDGHQVMKAPVGDSGQYCISTSNWSLGSIYAGSQSGSNVFTGSIDDVVIYGQAISTAQVERLYAEGLTRHTVASVQ